MPEASGSGVGLGVMGVADEQDYSTFENRTGLADDMKFLASMPELCDVTFLVGDTREPVCAVKAVLAARSRKENFNKNKVLQIIPQNFIYFKIQKASSQ
ncbi:hypothetical protein KQX54_007279 [Cotesia glomerata]|uniref:Uncharacterized protein n=1 Tax=Cotesia glomerata TaxID=32391 RepID=A0AAV7IJ67_COTGL|nr:hypothetical protein KQX54_007279 [Cotesia glomerata]